MSDVYLDSAKNIRDFSDILHEVQEYISGKYAILISHDSENQKDQMKSYITKYLMDYSLAVEDMNLDELVETLYSEMAEYSFLTKYIFRSDIEEININGWNDIKVTYSNGEILPIKETFNSPSHAIDVIRRLLHKSGMILDQSQPIVVGHLSERIRITVLGQGVIDPAIGVAVSIRIVNPKKLVKEDFIRQNTASEEMLDFLSLAHRYGESLCITGATSSGKTTLMSWILSTLPDNKRLYTIENGTREFNLVKKNENGEVINNVIHTVTRHSDDPKQNITMVKLLETGLTVNPDYICVAEMKSEEAFFAQESARTGHGVTTTIHASSCIATYYRMVTLCKQRYDMDERTLYNLVTEAFPIVAFSKKLEDNSRHIMEITECEIKEDGSRAIRTLYKFNVMDNAFVDGKLKIIGEYEKVNDEAIGEVLKRVIPMSSFVGGFPFSSSGYNDGTGYYFGRDNTGGLVVLDPWKRGNDRTNTNFTIMGVAGVGKSTVVKHIALSEYMKGTKIIFIDPEREMKELCMALDGDWINAGGGANGKINPLQIRPTPVDEDDKYYKDEGNGMGDMAIYMKNLEIFFSLYLPAISDKQKAILKNTLIELYNNFGIYWDTDINKLSNNDFPVFLDLYNLLKEKIKDKLISSNEQNEYEELALLLQDIALGSDAFLWNGKSSIETNTRCICLDTHDLQNTSDNIKRTQYFNILTWCWQQMSLDRTEPVLLICDESYLMIDPNVPQSLVFLRNVEKRARKYEAGIAIISHSVVDFLDPKVKMYGQALLDIPAYKILMGCDGMNLIETKQLFNLTDAEEQLLAQKKRGNALVMIGSKRLHVNFQIPDYKFKFMGNSGGR